MPKRGEEVGAQPKYFASPLPRVIAHRGFSAAAPENTLLAFAKAVGAGASYLETDVRASSDGKAMLAHDASLERTAGRDVRVSQLTAAELERVELGEGQGYARLAAALEALPEAYFNIEVKEPEAVEATAKVINQSGAHDRVLLTAAVESTRRALLALVPGTATSASRQIVTRALYGGALSGKLFNRVVAGVDALQVPRRSGAIKVITPRLIRNAHAVGVEVHAWTINDATEILELLELGVDGIISDQVDVALSVAASFVAAR